MNRPPRSYAYRGAGLEATLDLAHGLYNRRGTARIRRYFLAGSFRKQARGGAVLVPLPKADQPPDYHGCVAGRMVVFDAKETDDPARWRLDSRYGHQVDRLAWWAEAGALAFFAVECRPLGPLHLLRVFPVDVDVPYMPARVWPEIRFDQEYPVRFVLVVRPTSEGWYDWLAAVQAAGWLPPA